MKTRLVISFFFCCGQTLLSWSANAQTDTPDPLALDERFSTEGYVGLFVAGLQSSLPAVGLTASVFLDNDLRAGLDLWRGKSSPFFSSFQSQGTGLWTAWEFHDTVWLKGGVSYSRLDRPTGREPLSVLVGTKDNSVQRPVRTDALQVDVSVGQLWTFSHMSVAADYLGFSLPFLTMLGPKQTVFNVHALRVDFLYDID